MGLPNLVSVYTSLMESWLRGDPEESNISSACSLGPERLHKGCTQAEVSRPKHTLNLINLNTMGEKPSLASLTLGCRRHHRHHHLALTLALTKHTGLPRI